MINKLDDSTAVFTVPYLPVGIYTLDISKMGVMDKKTVVISSYTPVENPEAVINRIDAEITDAILIAENSVDKRYVSILKNLEQTFQKEYRKLSETEKKEVGYRLGILMNRMDEENNKIAGMQALPLMVFSQPFNILNTKYDGEDMVREARAFGKYASAAVLLILGGADLALGFPDLTTKVVGVGAIAAGIAVLVKGLDHAELVFWMIFKHETFNEVALSANSQSRLMKAMNINGSNFSFSRSQPTLNFTVTSEYRSLSKADKLTTNEFIKRVFENMNKLVQTHTKLQSLTNTIKKWFTSIPAMPMFIDPIPESPKAETRATPPSHLSVENISDGRISLTLTGQGELMSLTIATVVSTEVAFTFDLVYRNEDLQITNRKNINAIYDGAVYAGKLEIVSGNGQLGELGKKLPGPLKVRVSDNTGKAMEGAKVSWSVKSGGGNLDYLTSLTDASGFTQVGFTFGSQLDVEVEASTPLKDGSLSKVVFLANAREASSIAVLSGNNQIGELGKRLSNPLTVRVTDNTGQVMGGIKVSWSIRSGGGSLSQATSTTDASGLAQVEYTLGTQHDIEVEASIPIKGGSIAKAKFVGHARAAAGINILDGNHQMGELGKKLSKPLKIKITDIEGKALAGVKVTWTVKLGSGSLNHEESVTDINGAAQVEYTLGTESNNQIEVSVVGKNAIVIKAIFIVDVREADELSDLSGNHQEGQINKKLANPLRVVVKDKKRTVMEGVKVQWKVRSGGGLLSSPESVTNSSGIAQVEWTLGNSDKHEVEAIVKRSDGSFVNYSPLLFVASIDSMSYYQSVIPGDWTMTWAKRPDSQDDPQIDKFRFKADGTGIYYAMKMTNALGRILGRNQQFTM